MEYLTGIFLCSFSINICLAFLIKLCRATRLKYMVELKILLQRHKHKCILHTVIHNTNKHNIYTTQHTHTTHTSIIHTDIQFVYLREMYCLKFVTIVGEREARLS